MQNEISGEMFWGVSFAACAVALLVVSGYAIYSVNYILAVLTPLP
ncbi:MAG: hypothetical protein WCX69_04655 [Candidatus Paceibacterota bacterium]